MAPGAATLRTEGNVAAQSIFTFLSPTDLEYARLHARPRHMLAGTLLFLEGEPSAGLVLVQRGALRLFTAHAGKELTLHVVLRGETCNEFAAVSSSANLTSAEAIDDTTVLTLAPTHVSYLFGRSNGFARALVATMADRAHHFVTLVGDLSFHHVTARVAKVLLQSVSSAPGVGAGTGRRSLTQQELADLVGTAREVVARSLRTFYAMGAIAQVRGRIVVLDRRLLEDAVGESCAMAARTAAPAQHRPHVVGANLPAVTPAPRAPTRSPPPRPAPPEFETEMAVVAPLREKLPA